MRSAAAAGRGGSEASQRGQTLAEFALVVPLILLLLLGAVDLGRAVFAYNTLAQAARTGTRTAIVNQDPATVRSRVIESAATLGLATSNVDVCFKTSTSTQTSCASSTIDNCPIATRQIGCQALVTARLTYKPMTPFVGLLFNTINVSSTSVATIEFVCPASSIGSCP
jgi:Flp pilus assembly protein TadG